jgi:hypothetical protein
MNSFKQLVNHYLIYEAISLKQAKKKILSKKYSGAYNERLNEIFDGKNRIISRINIDYSNLDSPLMKKIDALLDDDGYTVGDMASYIKGFAYKIKGNDEFHNRIVDSKNPVKIGKLLQKYEADGQIELTDRKDNKKTTKWVTGKPLLHEFKNDPIRSSNGEFLLVISRHPYDIAGASTDRSWTSCMDLGLPRINYPKTKQNEGINRKYIPKDIEEGTLVAYVVPKDELFIGPNGDEKVKLHKPLSRILMKPHNSDVGMVYTVGTRYGAQYPEFYQQVKEWTSKTLNNKLQGKERVYKNPKLYNDGDTPVDFEFNTGNKVADQVMTELLNHNNEKEVGNQITFETNNNGNVTSIELKIVIDFGKEIVRPFEYLYSIYSAANSIKSEYEKKVATSIFQNLRGRGGRGYNDGSPRVTVTSLGDGIEIEVECNIQVTGEEDKYIDDDIIWDNTYYSMEWLKSFDYKQLKRDLYKICSTYDWNAHDEAMMNSINEALDLYKNLLNNYPKYNAPDNVLFNSLEVISPLEVLKLEVTTIKNLHNYLYRTVRAFETLAGKIIMTDRKADYSFQNDNRYTEAKFDIFYNWYERTFGVDLAEYKNETEDLWRITGVFDLVRKLRETGDPDDKERSELLLNIREEQGKIINYIRRLIGYKGEIKI